MNEKTLGRLIFVFVGAIALILIFDVRGFLSGRISRNLILSIEAIALIGAYFGLVSLENRQNEFQEKQVSLLANQHGILRALRTPLLVVNEISLDEKNENVHFKVRNVGKGLASGIKLKTETSMDISDTGIKSNGMQFGIHGYENEAVVKGNRENKLFPDNEVRMNVKPQVKKWAEQSENSEIISLKDALDLLIKDKSGTTILNLRAQVTYEIPPYKGKKRRIKVGDDSYIDDWSTKEEDLEIVSKEIDPRNFDSAGEAMKELFTG